MSVDIVFSMDSTGSMYPCFSELRRKVEETIARLFHSIPDLRIGLIAHGDYNDYPYTTLKRELTDDQGSLVKYIRDAEQTNGFGNGGECYELVLHESQDFNWRADKKVFVMLGDEPAHYLGKSVRRSYYEKDNTLVTLDWKREAQLLQDKGITCYMVRCMNRNDSREYHNSLSKLWNTPLLTLTQFSDIERLITALVFHQGEEGLLESYSNELEVSGKLNRGVADLINSLLGKNLQTASYKPAYGDSLTLVDPSRFQVLHVDYPTDIKSFVLSSGARFQKGKGFYEHTKREEIQEKKEVILQDKITGDFYTGSIARSMIGLPYGQRGNLSPQLTDKYRTFVQSTSVNRKLVPHTMFLYEIEYY